MGNVTLQAKPHPFKADLYTCEIAEGKEIAEIIPGASDDVVVQLNGAILTREQWNTRLVADDDLLIYRVPAGDAVGAVLQVVVVAFAALVVGPAIGGALGFGSFGSALVTAGVTVVGGMVANALIPPKLPTQKAQSPSERLASITGTRNQVNRFGVIPRSYGSPRWFPPLGALPYTEIVGSDQYLRMLLVLGYGPLQVGSHIITAGNPINQSTAPLLPAGTIKIGETDISLFQDVEWEIGYPDDIRLYTRDINEQAVNVPYKSAWVKGAGCFSDPFEAIRTSAVDARELAVDLSWDNGLFTIQKDGDQKPASVDIIIEYRVAGSGSGWTSSGAPLTHSDSTKKTKRFSWRWKVSPGQYEVRVRRTQSCAAKSARQFVADFTWLALRSYQSGQPYLGNHIVMALRIRATDQLNSVIDQLSIQTQARLPTWNGSSLVYATTNNPAWAYLDVLRGPQVNIPVPDSQIDMGSLLEWANWCSTNGLEYHWVHDANETIYERLRTIAAAGLASFAIQDGVYTIVRDRTDAPTTQVITPRNSSGIRATRIFQDLPHALRVKYIDPDTWQDAERIVYRSGFNAGNATKFEDFETQGVASADEAWFHGNYFFRQAQLRPERFSVVMDFEHLASIRGDRVRLAHDVLKIGLGTGRIKSLVLSGPDVSEVTLDEKITVGVDSYAMRFRKQDGTHVVVAVTPAGVGDIDTFTLGTPTAGINVGDLVLFGLASDESFDCKIVGIRPNSDLSAQVTLVPAALDIYNFGAAPVYDPGITQPILLDRIPPPPPTIRLIRSGLLDFPIDSERSLQPAIQVDYTFAGTVALPALQIQARYRLLAYSAEEITDGGTASVSPVDIIDGGSASVSHPDILDGNLFINGAWQYGPMEDPGGTLTVFGVVPGARYAIEVRSLNGILRSPWSNTAEVVVELGFNDKSIAVEADQIGKQAGLVVNGNFEAGDRDWDYSEADGWTIDEDPTNAYQGTWLAIKETGAANSSLRNTVGTFAVQTGDRVEYGGFIRSDGADGSAGWRVRWLDANLGVVSFSSQSISSGGWAKVRAVVAAPANAAFGHLEAFSTSHTAGTWYYDQGFGARMPRDLDIDALQTTNGPAEAGADVTGNNTAANIAGQGALATLNTVGGFQIDNSAVGTAKLAGNAVTSHVLSESSTTRNLTEKIVTGTGIPTYNRAEADLVHTISGVTIDSTSDVLDMFFTIRMNVTDYHLNTRVEYYNSTPTLVTQNNTPDAFYLEITRDTGGTPVSLYQEFWESFVKISNITSASGVFIRNNPNNLPYTDGSLNIPVVADFATSIPAGTHNIKLWVWMLDRHNQYHGTQMYTSGGAAANTMNFPALVSQVTFTTGKVVVYKR